MNPEADTNASTTESPTAQQDGLQVTRPTLVAADPDRGKALAITGIVFSILPLQLIGLILSIIAKVRATKGSSVNTLAIIGIILNIIFGFIVTGIILAIVLTAYAGLQEKAVDTQQRAELFRDKYESR